MEVPVAFVFQNRVNSGAQYEMEAIAALAFEDLRSKDVT